MLDFAISVNNIFKRYIVFDSNRSKLLHYFFLLKNNKGMREVWALKDINFQIKRGEAVAIIGRNGGGKSTLLEILAGTLTPTKGSIKVHGRVSAMLELGSGFNPQYSGRENVLLNGLLLGLCKDDILSRFDEIEAFAEIGLAIDQPVKTYSTGMIMRLAFAVQILCDPDILIIDEALSVGDFFFQQKCLSYIRDLIAKGVTLLFVSHDMGMVRNLCTKALYLKHGKLEWSGEVNTAIQYYLTEGHPSKIAKFPKVDLSNKIPRADSLGVAGILYQQLTTKKATQILSVTVQNGDGNETLTAQMGETLRFLVKYRAEELSPVHVCVTLKNQYNQVVNSSSSYNLGLEMPSSFGSNYALYILALEMQLEAGQYSFQVNLTNVNDSKANQGFALDETPWLGPLIINFDYSQAIAPFLGMFGLPAKANLPTLSS